VFDCELAVIARVLKVDLGGLYPARAVLDESMPELLDGRKIWAK
jgi:hypothetical protein